MFRRPRPNPGLALVLACGLLLAGIPLAPLTAPHRGAAICSLDICHPAQAISAASAQCSLGAPSAASSFAESTVTRAVSLILPPLLTIAAPAPDTPPPKPSTL